MMSKTSTATDLKKLQQMINDIPEDVTAIPATLPYRPDTIREEGFFSPMLQGTGTNKLTQISTRKTAPENIDAITGIAKITSGSLTVFIEKYNNLAGGLRISTHKLLDACTIALTAQNDYRGNKEPNTTVTIPLEEYMQRCGIPLTKPSKDKTRRKVKEDLEALYSTSIEWTEPSGKNTKDFAKMRICTAVAIKNGNIIMDFSPAIASYLTNAYVMQYPVELLAVDERNPSSYYIGKKLMQHNSIDNNIKRGTANIISVKALLASCPDIPTYEEVMSKDRALDRRIKTPFENALNSLPFIKWEYSNSKGKPLTDEQLKDFSYATFKECYILFTVLNAPDQTKRLTARAEEAAEKKKAASRAKKKTDKQ